jgi:hypothetical protein
LAIGHGVRIALDECQMKIAMNEPGGLFRAPRVYLLIGLEGPKLACFISSKRFAISHSESGCSGQNDGNSRSGPASGQGSLAKDRVVIPDALPFCGNLP